MRQNDGAFVGSSQYFRIAAIYGGLPGSEDHKEHFVRGSEAFPVWHRAYLHEFEHMFRLADIANGEDGKLGVPYWDWTKPVVDGQTYPNMLRRPFGRVDSKKYAPMGLLTEFPAEFFPAGAARAADSALIDLEQVSKLSDTASSVPVTALYHNNRQLMLNDMTPEATCRLLLEQSGVIANTRLCGATATYGEFATKLAGIGNNDVASASGTTDERSLADRRPDAISLETLHEDICTFVGGMIGTNYASFHPLFWFHLSQLDRIFDNWLVCNPSASTALERSSAVATRTGTIDRRNGTPDGIFGPLAPLKSPLSARVHKDQSIIKAADVFNSRGLGFTYDKLPGPPSRSAKEREPIHYAHFHKVDAAAADDHQLIYVFVSDESKSAAPIDFSQKGLLQYPGLAGVRSVWFGEGASTQSKQPNYDIMINLSETLKRFSLHPTKVTLFAVVGTPGMIDAVSIAETSIPPPVLQGPTFYVNTLVEDGKGPRHGGGDPNRSYSKLQRFLIREEVMALQRMLIQLDLKETDIVDGFFHDVTDAAVKMLQARAKLKPTGIVTTETKRALLRWGLLQDHEPGTGVLCTRGQLSEVHDPGRSRSGTHIPVSWTMAWVLENDTVPGHLPHAAVRAELEEAFALWAGPAKVRFVHDATHPAPHIRVRFANRSRSNAAIVNGPGGALVEATQTTMTFDSSERWELRAVQHPHRPLREYFNDWDYFQLFPAALHAMGHVLGLDDAIDGGDDAMSPYYSHTRTTLSANDVRRITELTKACSDQDLPTNQKIARRASTYDKFEDAMASATGSTLTRSPKRGSVYDGFGGAVAEGRGSVYDGFDAP